MGEVNMQKQILGTLTEVKSSIEALKKNVSYMMKYIEDTKLTEEERKQLSESITKIRAGNTSDFVSWKQAKKELPM